MSDYRRWPALEHLCDLAKHSGVQVRLRASPYIVSFGRGAGEEYRQLTRIELWPMRHALKPVSTVAIVDDDIEAAALELLARAA